MGGRIRPYMCGPPHLTRTSLTWPPSRLRSLPPPPPSLSPPPPPSFVFNFLLYTTTPRIAEAAARKDTGAVSRITAQVGRSTVGGWL